MKPSSSIQSTTINLLSSSNQKSSHLLYRQLSSHKPSNQQYQQLSSLKSSIEQYHQLPSQIIQLQKPQPLQHKQSQKITYHYPFNSQQFKTISSPQQWKHKYQSIKQLPPNITQQPKYKICGPKISQNNKQKLYLYCTYRHCKSSFIYQWINNINQNNVNQNNINQNNINSKNINSNNINQNNINSKYINSNNINQNNINSKNINSNNINQNNINSNNQSGYYKLVNAKMKHQHFSQQQQKRNRIKSKTQKMLNQYIKTTLTKDPSIQFKDIKKHLSSKLNIKDNRLRYHYDLAKATVRDLHKKSQLFDNINKNNAIFACQKYQDWKNQNFRFIITCEQMIKSYQKWYKVTYCTIHYTEQFQQSEDNIFIGTFSGINGNLQSVPFALFLIKMNYKSLGYAIKQFFSKMIMLGKFQQQPGTSQKDFLPRSLIVTYTSFSDELHKFLLSKECCLFPNLSNNPQSSFKGMTFIHEASSFLQKFKNQNIAEYIMTLSQEKYIKLIIEPQKIRFSEWMERDLQKIGYNFEIDDGEIMPYEQFLQKSQKVCLSQFKEGTFIGSYLLQQSKRLVSQPQSRRLLSNFMSNYPKVRDSGFVIKFYNCFNEMKNRCKQLQIISEDNHQRDNYEDILKIPEIAKISFVVQKRIFRIIIQKLMSTIGLKTFKNNGNTIFVYNNSSSQSALEQYENTTTAATYSQVSSNMSQGDMNIFKQSRQYYYEVHYDNKEHRWNCQCGYFALRGLPCEHQMAICIRYNYSIEKQISKYWMRQDQKIVFWNEPKKRGRPRQSEYFSAI